MDFKAELNNKILPIREWLNENKIGSTPDKTKSVAWEIFYYVTEHCIENDDISAIREKLKQNPFQIPTGHLWEQLSDYFKGNQKYVAFFKDIGELTPVGLNTSPNACCGKFELLYRLLRPNSKQPNKGDIIENGEIYELKGCEVRISDTELTGIEYRKICTKIFEGNIIGNTAKIEYFICG